MNATAVSRPVIPVLLPGATLGVMGGGQLGRMFAHAAQQLGYEVAVVDPDANSPAGGVAQRHIVADYLDASGWEEVARHCSAVTTEFENVPAEALRALAHRMPVAPNADAVAICQDRALEKAHFTRCGVPCAAYVEIRTVSDIDAAPAALLPGILKTNQMGYDGKGQIRVQDRDELAQAWQQLRGVPCLLEQQLPLALEVSVIVARSSRGELVHFPTQQNLHRDGVLAVTTVPAGALTSNLQAQAIGQAQQIAVGMSYIGVLCVEFFVLADGRLVANEMAPRPHNSGHYTIDACDVSQFDLQVRCMAGLPLVAPRLHSSAIMINLLGDLWLPDDDDEKPCPPPWDQILALPGVHLHLYGKTAVRRGRKMGHLTITSPTPDAAQKIAEQVASLLGLPSW